MKLSSAKIYLGYLHDSPLGDFRLASSDLGLLAVEWTESQPQQDTYLSRFGLPFEINEAKTHPYSAQLLEYLSGQRKSFTFDIDWTSLRPFQREAMQVVFGIPYGKTLTYAEVAQQIARPNAYRAVGRANATNPMPLVIPCHRVIGADGKLHGYGGRGGLKTKERLLKMESAK